MLDKLKAGDADVKLADLPALIKLEMLIDGEATDRIETTEVQQVIHSVFVIAGRFIPPSDRAAFLEAIGDSGQRCLRRTRDLCQIDHAPRAVLEYTEHPELLALRLLGVAGEMGATRQRAPDGAQLVGKFGEFGCWQTVLGVWARFDLGVGCHVDASPQR